MQKKGFSSLINCFKSTFNRYGFRKERRNGKNKWLSKNEETFPNIQENFEKA